MAQLPIPRVSRVSRLISQVKAGYPADVPIVAQGAASQTGDLLQLQNSSGTVLFKVDSTGNAAGPVTVPTGKTAVVTDADGLTVGGKIVPQTFLVMLRANSVVHPLPAACKIVSVKERHGTAEATAGSLTAMVKKVPSATAIAGGTDTLAAGINMKATANTNQAPALHATAANYTFAAGDGVGVLLSGAATELATEGLTIEFQRV